MPNDKIPNDADGDTIRRVAESGSNLSKPMDIDFQIIVSSKLDLDEVEARLALKGFQLRKHYHSDTQDWDVIATCSMILNYDAVIEAQNLIAKLLSDLKCEIDGWGTRGNSQKGIVSGTGLELTDPGV